MSDDIYVYIAGPIYGKNGYNVSAFFKAEVQLREKGYEPINLLQESHDTAKIKNPSEHLPLETDVFREWIIRNKADAILLLNGWAETEAARQEKIWAEDEGLLVYFDTGELPEQRTEADFEKEIKCLRAKTEAEKFTRGIEFEKLMEEKYKTGRKNDRLREEIKGMMDLKNTKIEFGTDKGELWLYTEFISDSEMENLEELGLKIAGIGIKDDRIMAYLWYGD